MPAYRRNRFFGPGLFMSLLLLVVIGTGVTFTLWYLEVIRLPFLEVEAQAQNTVRPVLVPISGRTIPAFTKISRDDLWNPSTNGWAVVPFNPKQLDPAVLTSRKQIMGRVMSREKQPGYVFTESDFLPVGTRPGLVGGIPPGKVAYRIEAAKVRGLHDLNVGDTFDLISTLPVDANPNDLKNLQISGQYGQQLAFQAAVTNALKRATTEYIVQGGVIVQPVSVRAEPYSANTFTSGMITRTRPVQEAVIAIWPEEVPFIAEALAVEANIQAIPHSGNPKATEPVSAARPVPAAASPEAGPDAPAAEAPGPASLPHSAPLAGTGRDSMADLMTLDFLPPDMRVVETINGATRDIRAVPAKEQKKPKGGK